MSWKRKLAQLLLRFGYRVLNVNMLDENHKLVGINMGTTFADSSENRILESVIFKNLSPTDLVVDVGANIGSYSQMMCEYFQHENVLSFEPNPKCIPYLQENLKNPFYSIAIGNETGEASFYIHTDDPISKLASLKGPSLKIIDKEVSESIVEVKRLEDFLGDESLPVPSFVKIDTEGNDLEVIKGLGHFLNDVKFIQFEFNHQYIYNRIFLKDFYEILSNFKIYRIGKKGLIDLNKYSPFYEIFVYQNLLAVNKNLNIELPLDS